MAVIKKALNPCLWIGIVAIAVLSITFLIRNAIPSPALIDPTQITKSDTTKIEINSADAAELLTIPGFGQSTVNAIINYRTENGPFTDLSQLLDVPGIGQKKFLTLLEYIYLEE